MWSKPMFKQIVRANYKLFVLFTGILCAYMALCIGVFNPQTLGGLDTLMQSMGGMGEAFGSLMGDFQNVNSFIGHTFYGLIAVLFPMLYCIIVGNRLIAAQVDRGSMANWLSTPTRRNQITGTSALFLGGSLLAMFAVTGAVGLGAGALFQPGALAVSSFWMLNLGCFLLLFAISGICFAASCTCNLSRTSLAWGAGIPVAFFLFQMIAQLAPSLDFFRYLTIQSLFDPAAILAGQGYAGALVALGCIGLVCYAVGMQVFARKDLPL